MAKKEDIKKRYAVFILAINDESLFTTMSEHDELYDAQKSLNKYDSGGVYDRQENRIVQLKES